MTVPYGTPAAPPLPSSSPPAPMPFSTERWARETLGIPDDVTCEALLPAVFAKLDEAEYVPPPHWEQAIECLASPATPIPSHTDGGYAIYRAVEGRVLRDVYEFTSRFFEWPPDERRARWQRLVDSARHVVGARAWLLSLESGLSVDPTLACNDPDGCTAAAANHLRATFAAPPSVRAVLNLTFIQNTRMSDHHQWHKAVLRMRAAHPVVAALGPSVLNAVASSEWLVFGGQASLQRARPKEKRGERGWLGYCMFGVYVLLVVIGIIANHSTSPRPKSPYGIAVESQRKWSAPTSTIDPEKLKIDRETYERMSPALKRFVAPQGFPTETSQTPNASSAPTPAASEARIFRLESDEIEKPAGADPQNPFVDLPSGGEGDSP